MAWRVRPPPAEVAEQIHHRNEITQAWRATNCRLTSSSCDKLLTDCAWCITLLPLNGFAVRFSRSAIFFISEVFGDDLPLIEILRSLVVYVNHHDNDYLRRTPCDWLRDNDAAFVKLLWPLVTFYWNFNLLIYLLMLRSFWAKYHLRCGSNGPRLRSGPGSPPTEGAFLGIVYPTPLQQWSRSVCARGTQHIVRSKWRRCGLVLALL